MEILTVLGVCAVLLVALGMLDNRAARREAARATAVVNERSTVAGERASREAMTAPTLARPDHLGRDAWPIVIPAGSAWGPGTSVVSHTQRQRPEVQAVTTPGYRKQRPDPPLTGDDTAEVPAAPVAAGGGDGGRWDAASPILLLLMAAAGLSMSAAGLRMLSRPSA
jgi:hypothetical protein